MQSVAKTNKKIKNPILVPSVTYQMTSHISSLTLKILKLSGRHGDYGGKN